MVAEIKSIREGYKMTELGEIPVNWEIVSIGEIASEKSERAGEKELKVLSVTKYDGIVAASEYFNKTVASRNTSNYKMVRKGDFAYATVHLDEGSIGLSNFEIGIVSPMYTVFRANSERVDFSFLFSLLKSHRMMNIYQLIGQGGVDRRRSIAFKTLSETRVALPSLEEQQKIAEILSNVDEQIEITDQKIVKTKELKKGLMQQLLNKGIGHTEFKKPKFGSIPVEWEAKTVGELIKFEGGQQPPRKYFINEKKEGYIRLIQIRDYKTDKYKTYIPIEMAKRFCEEEDIMIGRYGPPIFQILRGIKGSYNVALIKATPNNKLQKNYAYYYHL
ncbi:restriction endonuclease subunit S [Bacillus cereus group sp. BfR-BA-01349]|uniref:restriction endonuclease subunit S n=1 Tax=Bacillus cereus group sp. BfR-BA-01349 TaxID=2920312 RepID=UPI001F56C045